MEGQEKWSEEKLIICTYNYRQTDTNFYRVAMLLKGIKYVNVIRVTTKITKKTQMINDSNVDYKSMLLKQRTWFN